MNTVSITCAQCGVVTQKCEKEIRRRIKVGATRFFCSSKCAGVRVNGDKRVKNEALTCRWCGAEFFGAPHGKRAVVFCSRSCASAGSVTDLRRQVYGDAWKTNFSTGAHHSAMMHREGWKYVELQARLELQGVAHVFEEKLDGSNASFDLLLLDHKIIVEFDGPYHKSPSQKARDEKRDEFAQACGWKVVRIKTKPATIIPAVALDSLDLSSANFVVSRGSCKSARCVSKVLSSSP